MAVEFPNRNSSQRCTDSIVYLKNDTTAHICQLTSTPHLIRTSKLTLTSTPKLLCDFFLLESTVTIYTDKIFGFSQHLCCLWESNIRAIDGHWISEQKFESTMYRFCRVSKKWFDCTHLPINLHITFNDICFLLSPIKKSHPII